MMQQSPRIYTFNYDLPQVLGLGADLKNSICHIRGNQAYLSPCLGDMNLHQSVINFEKVLQQYKQEYEFQPQMVVSDLHPDFYSSIKAGEFNLPYLQLQHHYAHLVATIASIEANKQKINPLVLGCMLDGYGYGDDGSAWGGELIKLDIQNLTFKRISHFPLITVAGGDSAERHPWKLALIWCIENNLPIPPHIANMPEADRVKILAEKGLITRTSSAGRVFSLVSSLLDVCNQNSFEAEAAIRLESLVSNIEPAEELVGLSNEGLPDIGLLIKLVYHIAYIKNTKERAINVFYANLAAVLVRWIIHHAKIHSITQVAIGGGCWQSRYLLPLVKQQLQFFGIELLIPHNLPVNDEGISLGQAWYGAKYLLKKGIR